MYRNPPGYSLLRDIKQAEITVVTGKKFFVHLARKTDNTHHEFVAKLKGIGKIEVASPEDSDFLVVFCPVLSRVGPDIRTALSSTPGGKPIILVVMHQTFNPEHVVAESRRQVFNPNVLLTVDCLYHERNLLKSIRNDIVWYDVEKFLGSSVVPTWNYRKIVACVVMLALLLVIIVLVVEELKKKV